MNGLFLNSSVSLESSSEQHTVESHPTSSSDGQPEGLGTISGRAIFAFGEATLRGFENLAIARKLRTIHSVFPHRDDDSIKDIDKIYDDVLELSRCLIHIILLLLVFANC